MPRCTNVLVAARAPVSCTGTRRYSSPTNVSASACAAASSAAAQRRQPIEIAAERALEREAPRGEVVPARAARRLRIRRDDLDARSPSRSGQSRMPFGLPLRTRNTIVDVYGELLFGNRDCHDAGRRRLTALDVVDVPRERERHDVRIEPVDDGARLAARAAVRHLHADALAGVGEPLRDELLVELAIQLARRIVRHVQELELAPSSPPPEPPQAPSATTLANNRFRIMVMGIRSERERRVCLRGLRLRSCRDR